MLSQDDLINLQDIQWAIDSKDLNMVSQEIIDLNYPSEDKKEIKDMSKKVCSKCGKERDLKYFKEGDDVCKFCHLTEARLKSPKVMNPKVNRTKPKQEVPVRPNTPESQSTLVEQELFEMEALKWALSHMDKFTDEQLRSELSKRGYIGELTLTKKLVFKDANDS
jgi:hypothetical protein